METKIENFSKEKNSWIVECQENSINGDIFIILPKELLEKAKLKEGDKLIFNDNKDGSYTLKKKI